MDNLFKPKNTPFQKMEEFVQVDFSDYKSPIEAYIHEQWQQHKQKVEDIIEDNVFRQVLAVGVNVDKNELLKALMYDRNQYGDGYAAGVRAAAQKWISVDDPPKNMRKVFVYTFDGTMAITYYNPLSEMWDFNHDYKITHWMPLPEPPEEYA